jgi:hypothetical protein
MYPGRIRWSDVVEQARLVVAAYEGGVTLRQCFYRLAVAGVIPNTAAAYRKLSAHLAEARRRGGFPDLIDAVREIHVPPAFAAPGELLARREQVELVGLAKVSGHDLLGGLGSALLGGASRGGEQVKAGRAGRSHAWIRLRPSRHGPARANTWQFASLFSKVTRGSAAMRTPSVAKRRVGARPHHGRRRG